MQPASMSIVMITEELRQRVIRLKEKYGVSFRQLAREAKMSQSHLMRFVWQKHHNLMAQTLTRLDATVSRLTAEREAR
jgi:lambda repressor-like predicted transcriptional regulator